jgi:hypothetical protein
LGGDYENISIREMTTMIIPLELAYQFEFDGELPNAYPDAFYDIMSVETLNEMFEIDFESEHEWVVISHGRKIGELVYDINWRLTNYEKSWGSIAIPLYERGYSPSTIYVYTSYAYRVYSYKFPLNELYTGKFHNYFTADIRYVDDVQIIWYILEWYEGLDSIERNFWQELKFYIRLHIPFVV